MFNRWMRYGSPRNPFRIDSASQQARGLIGCWLTGASWGGNIIRNLVGLGPSEAIVDPAAASWSSFSLGRAITVEANNAVNFGQNVQVIGGDYTLSFWLNLPSVPPGNFNWDKRGSGGSGGFRLGFRSSEALLMTHWAASPAVAQVPNVLRFDGGHHYALCYDKTGAMFFYRDGQAVGSDTLAPMILGTPVDLTIDTTGLYTYHIFEIRLYNRMLSDAEIFLLFNPQTRWSLYQPLHQPLGFAPTVPVLGLLEALFKGHARGEFKRMR